ncbi:MAG: STAS domain-containing protein [Phycisphaerae bacterium]|nr:STAS domain-containing protein [Phycisphaerae bacterium]
MATQDWSDDIVLVDLADDPELSDELNAITDRMEKDARDVVVNFSNVKFLNSSNISRLLKLRKILLDSGRNLRLCSIAIQVWGVFLLTGLDSLFEVNEDTASALASLQIKEK